MAWNFTDAERRALVKLQLRDSKGRWIEMGKGVKWYSPVAKKEVSGVVIGGKGKNALVELTSEPPKNGKPQQVSVLSTDLDVIDSKASLGTPATEAPEATPEAPEPTPAPATPAAPASPAQGATADAIDKELGYIESDIEDMNEMEGDELDKALDEAEYPITTDGGKDAYLRPNKYEGTDDWYVDLLDEEGEELGSWDMPTGDNALTERRAISKEIREAANKNAVPAEAPAEPEAPATPEPAPEAAPAAPEAEAPAETPEPEAPAEKKDDHPVKGKAEYYPDGTKIKSSRTGEVFEKTNNEWHVAGDPNSKADAWDIDGPIVIDMPSQGAETFEEFKGVDDVSPGDIVQTVSGAQAAVVGVRDGKLVVAPHNVPAAQANLRPSIVGLDPAKVTGVKKFGPAAEATPEPTPEAPETQAPEAPAAEAPTPAEAPAAPAPRTPVTARRPQRQTELTSNRGNINLEIADSQGNTVKRGDTVLTEVGEGVVTAVRPSDGPGGSVKVKMADGNMRVFRNNKITNKATAAPTSGDDPTNMAVGEGGFDAQGRKFIMVKGGKQIFKGDRVTLDDGSTGVVSGVYPNSLKALNIKIDGGPATPVRKKASVVNSDKDPVAGPAPAAPEPEAPAAEEPTTPEVEAPPAPEPPDASDDINRAFGGNFPEIFESGDDFSMEQQMAVRIAFEKMVQNTNKNLPEGVEARVDHLGIVERMMSFDIKFYKDGEEIGKAARDITFEFDEDSGEEILSVEHKLFKIENDHRGMGVSSAFLAEAEKLYKQMGIKQITTHANIDVGGYAWARAGFDWASIASARGVVARGNLLAQAYTETPKEEFPYAEKWTSEDLADYKSLMEKVTKMDWQQGTLPTPFQFSQIGVSRGSDFGKKLMLNSNWYGVKKLDD